jgi:hypothetical protein
VVRYYEHSNENFRLSNYLLRTVHRGVMLLGILMSSATVALLGKKTLSRRRRFGIHPFPINTETLIMDTVYIFWKIVAVSCWITFHTLQTTHNITYNRFCFIALSNRRIP